MKYEVEYEMCARSRVSAQYRGRGGVNDGRLFGCSSRKKFNEPLALDDRKKPWSPLFDPPYPAPAQVPLPLKRLDHSRVIPGDQTLLSLNHYFVPGAEGS